MKNSPRRLFFLHQTLQLALCIGACSVLLASAKPRFARWWSMIHHSRECISTAPVQWWRALLHSSQRLALVILGLCEAARPWKPISWSFQQTVTVLTLLPKAIWNLKVIVATENRRVMQICVNKRDIYALWSSAVVWPTTSWLSRSCSSTFPLHNNSTCSWPGKLLLARWHPMMVPRWKSLSSSVRPFYCQCLCMEIAWLCAQFYKPVNNGCGWNSQIHQFEGMSTYFCLYSVSQ